jgi:hypothetical protein
MTFNYKFVFLSPQDFLSTGLPLLNNLVNAGCQSAAVAIIARVVFSFATNFVDILNNST